MPVDTLAFDFEILAGESPREPEADSQLESQPTGFSGPNSGAVVEGLFLEGAVWDAKAKKLVDAPPRVLFSRAPRIWLKPSLIAKVVRKNVW